METSTPQHGILLRSIQGDTPEASEALQLSVYVDELQRQAEIASRSFTRAWLRAMRPETAAKDVIVWGDLQSALFATIVIIRILSEEHVRGRPKETKTARQRQATARAHRLRELLSIDDESALFQVREVRNAFEHFDERLDSLVITGRASVVDWHISRQGESLRTPPAHNGPALEAMRIFYPRAGTLHFGDQGVDMYAVDCALLALKNELAPAATEHLATQRGKLMTFGASQNILLVEPSLVEKRHAEWLRIRSEARAPVPPAATD